MPQVNDRPQRELTSREILDGLEGLQIVAESLAYHDLLDKGKSKEEAMKEVTRARLDIEN